MSLPLSSGPLPVVPPVPAPRASACGACHTSVSLFPFTMAFQPIVHLATGQVFAHEALVRGPKGESAWSVLSKVTDENRYAFDQECRVRAIEMARKLGGGEAPRISINFEPNAVYEPAACIRKTLETATRTGMPLGNIIFEVTEGERVTDRSHLRNIFEEYRRHGLRTAIDDFGAGYAQFNLLADFQPDVVKLDMALVRDVDKRPAAQRLIRAVAEACRDLRVSLVAEGIETREECLALLDVGLELFQGFLFGKPAFEQMEAPLLPAMS
jgi:EAL domain-containing protein (putative c-di-GMP-specific phosphodiesterase class I)